MHDVFYDKKVRCLYCDHLFLTKRMKRSMIRITSRDTDFCPHYLGENPLYYDVFVCPECGFSFTEGFSRLTPAKKERLYEHYIQKIAVPQLCGKRTVTDAIRCYKLAFLCADILGEKKYILANLCLRLAWLYREQQNKEEECRFLRQALSLYEEIYQTEKTNDIPMEEGMLLYLVGEISARLGDYEKTRRWFSYIFTNRQLDRKWRNMARERWIDYRRERTEITQNPEGFDHHE